jgi:ferredoxin--NADP+ reductase
LIADRSTWWKPAVADESAVEALLQERGVSYIDWANWLQIDHRERELGEAEGRERIKLVEREDFLKAAKG